MGACLDVIYKHNRKSAKATYVSNDDIQRLAQDVRRQIGCGNKRRISTNDLLAITAVSANGIRYELSWSVEGPVTDEQGEPVLGLCEYDPEGLPDTALIFANRDAVAGMDELLISTLAHELGHGLFDAPGWIAGARTAALPGLFASGGHQRFRSETPDEQHLDQERPRRPTPNFPEWRANEFMGSLLVPRDLLLPLLTTAAAAQKLPIEEVAPVTSLVPADPAGTIRIARDLRGKDRRFALPAVINALASEFGVSRRFMQVRLLRYSVIEEAQLTSR